MLGMPPGRVNVFGGLIVPGPAPRCAGMLPRPGIADPPVLGAILVRGVNDLFVGVEKLRPDGIGVTPRGAEKLGALGAEKLGARGAE